MANDVIHSNDTHNGIVNMSLVDDWQKQGTFLFTTDSYLSNHTDLTTANTTIVPDGISDSYPEITRTLYLYILPFLLFFGIFGNGLSFIIMVKGARQGTSVCVYLASLAVADTFYLSLGISWQLAYSYTYGALDFNTHFACTGYYFYSFSFQYSAWLLVCMTIERFFYIVYPIKSKKYLSVRLACAICGATAAFLAIFNVHWFFTLDVQRANDNPVCAPVDNPHTQFFLRQIWPVIDSLTYAILPGLIISVFNVLIVISLKNAKTQTQAAKRSYRTTVMLLTVTFAFIIFTVPIEVLYIYTQLSEDLTNTSYEYAIADILGYMNHAINFWLYCVVAERFRGELRRMFCGENKVTPETTQASSRQTKSTQVAPMANKTELKYHEQPSPGIEPAA